MKDDAYKVIKQAVAPKIGRRGGEIHYEIGHPPDESDGLSLRITTNPGSSGHFSRKWNRVAVLKEAINAATAEDECFRSKALKEAIIGKSSNDPGFICAALRGEGLLQACEADPMR